MRGLPGYPLEGLVLGAKPASERALLLAQTSTDKFYPDFVALLNDGRILVVELKGGHLWGSPDSEEKRKLGELWAERSGGSCLFVMPKGKDRSAIEALLQTPPPSGSLF